MTTKPSFKDIKRFSSASYSVDYPFEHLLEKIVQWQESGLELDPDFQRGHVWTTDKQIAYMEYLLRDGRSSRDIYFNHPNWMGSYKGRFVLVDGKQRLETIRRFYNNEIPAFGYFIDEYIDRPRQTQSLKIHINELKTDKEVLQWYLDLNSGGVVHTEDELEKVRKMIEEIS